MMTQATVLSRPASAEPQGGHDLPAQRRIRWAPHRTALTRLLGPTAGVALTLGAAHWAVAQPEPPMQRPTPPTSSEAPAPRPMSPAPAPVAKAAARPGPAAGPDQRPPSGASPPESRSQHVAAGQPPRAAAPEVLPQRPGLQPIHIERNSLLYLIRSTMMALHQANETGNYTVLRDIGAPGFQAANSAARLTEIFTALRAQKLDLSGTSVVEPQLIAVPQADASGFMLLEGYFPLATQVNFRLVFAPADGRWRLFGISVNLGGHPTAVAPGAVSGAGMPAPAARSASATPLP